MNTKINLLCLTFAGGTRYSYRKFREKAPSFLNVITLEYPGRGSRMSEPLISDIHLLVNDLYNQVKNIVSVEKYAIYGHSLGGLLAYLLTLKLMENNHNLPEHLFVTGTTGPSSVSRSQKKRHLLPKKEFIDEIRELGGMPDEILQNEELINFIEQPLRNDFSVSEQYEYAVGMLLPLGITVITGTEETMEAGDIRLWERESSKEVTFHQLSGGHFFILEHIEEILGIIIERLTKNTT